MLVEHAASGRNHYHFTSVYAKLLKWIADWGGCSRGIRQRLHNLTWQHNWYGKYKIWIGDKRHGVDESKGVPHAYGDALASSTFCLVLPGMDVLDRMARSATQ
jgi:hypothetical protein